MDNPPIFSFPASPGTPLFPVSPERTNQQRHMQPFPIAFPSLKKMSPPPEIPLLPTSSGDFDLDFDLDIADGGDENIQIGSGHTILEEDPDAFEEFLAPEQGLDNNNSRRESFERTHNFTNHETSDGLEVMQKNGNMTSTSPRSGVPTAPAAFQGKGKENFEREGASQEELTSSNFKRQFGPSNTAQESNKSHDYYNRRKSHRGTPRRQQNQQQRQHKKPSRASTSVYEGQVSSEQVQKARDKWAHFATMCPEWESGRVPRSTELETIPDVAAVMAKYRSSSSGSDSEKKNVEASESLKSKKQDAKAEVPVKSTRFAEMSPKQNDNKTEGSEHLARSPETNPKQKGHPNHDNNNRTRDRKRNDHALRRAELGREEAEGEVRRLRQELEKMNNEVAEATRLRLELEKLGTEVSETKKSRQTDKANLDKITKDAEKLKVDLITANTKLARAEKHHKRAVKDAMKTSSAIVGLQGDLKSAREDLNSVKSTLEMERVKSKKREEEAFQAQYKLIGVEEELARAKQQIKVLEGERDALKTNLKEEEVARIAAQGQIALPVSRDDGEFGSPKAVRKPTIKPNSLIEEEVEEIDMVKDQLEREKMRADEAEELVQFMQRECQLGICACQMAKEMNTEYIYDKKLHEHVKRRRAKDAHLSSTIPDGNASSREASTKSGSEPRAEIEAQIKAQPEILLTAEDAQRHLASTQAVQVERSTTPQPAPTATATSTPEAEEPPVMFSPTSGTFHTQLITSSQPTDIVDVFVPEHEPQSDLSAHDQPDQPDQREILQGLQDLNLEPQPPRQPTLASSLPPVRAISEFAPIQTPARRIITPAFPHTHAATTTTTRTIPLAPPADFSASVSSVSAAANEDAEYNDNALALDLQTMTREEALEQIRQRRGRAKSLAAGTFTPRKQMVNPAPKRDFSAPVGRPGGM